MQNMKCQKCDAPAEVHVTELVSDQKIELHLCVSCAESLLENLKGVDPIKHLAGAMLSEAVRENVAVMEVQPAVDCVRVRFRIGENWIERDRIPLRLKEKLAKRFGEIVNEPGLGVIDVTAETHLTINGRDVDLRFTSDASNPHAVTVAFSTVQ